MNEAYLTSVSSRTSSRSMSTHLMVATWDVWMLVHKPITCMYALFGFKKTKPSLAYIEIRSLIDLPCNLLINLSFVTLASNGSTGSIAKIMRSGDKGSPYQMLLPLLVLFPGTLLTVLQCRI